MNKVFRIILLFFIINFNLYSQVKVLRFEQINTKDGLPQNSVQSIVQDKYGFMWFSSFASISRYDGYKFTNYHANPDDPKALLSRGIYNIALDSAENVWIAFFDSSIICKYNYETDDFTRYARHAVPFYIIRRLDRLRSLVSNQTNIRDGIYWRFSENKLYKIDRNTGNTYSYCAIFPIEINVSPSCMYFDKFGIIWFGTGKQGVFKANTNVKPFYSYYLSQDNCENLINSEIRAFVDDEYGNLYIGTLNEGIIKINRKTRSINFIVNNPKNKNSLINNSIRKLYFDKYGYLWIGTKGGLDRYDIKHNKFYHYITDLRQPTQKYWVYEIMEDHNGDLWIGTFGGIARYDRKNDVFIWNDPNITLLSRRVTTIIEDSNYNLWIGTQGGGITCLKRTELIDRFVSTHYINIPDDTTSISSNRVFSIVESKDGYLWVATEYGFNKFDPKTGKFLRFNQKNGLPNEMIYGILLDNNNNLWLSHRFGLTNFNTQTNEMNNYTEQDGLQGNEFSENAFYKSPYTGSIFRRS